MAKTVRNVRKKKMKKTKQNQKKKKHYDGEQIRPAIITTWKIVNRKNCKMPQVRNTLLILIAKHVSSNYCTLKENSVNPK